MPKAAVRKRPRVISILGVYGFIVTAGQIIMISYPGIRAISKWYPVIYGLIIALRFFSLVGVWHMKKWGAELFAYTLLAKLIVQIAVGDFKGMSVVDISSMMPIAVVFLFFHSKMERNL